MNESVVDDALADIALHPERHDQHTWGSVGRPQFGGQPVEEWCGTTMCLAGFIAIRAGYHLTSLGKYRKGDVCGAAADIAMEEAGLSEDQAYNLFISSAHDDYKKLTARWNRMCGRELDPGSE